MSFLSESHNVPQKGYYWPHFTEEEPASKPLSHLTRVHPQFCGQARQNQVSIPHTVPQSLDAITTHHAFGHTVCRSLTTENKAKNSYSHSSRHQHAEKSRAEI